MARQEIQWKSRLEDGTRRIVSARREGKRWHFYEREKRYDNWMRLDTPSLEDWLVVLDGVRRRIPRRLLPPYEEQAVITAILKDYPEAEIPHSPI